MMNEEKCKHCGDFWDDETVKVSLKMAKNQTQAELIKKIDKIIDERIDWFEGRIASGIAYNIEKESLRWKIKIEELKELQQKIKKEYDFSEGFASAEEKSSKKEIQ